MTDQITPTATGADIMREFVPASPFAQLLEIAIEEIDDGRATLSMPYAPALATMGDMIRGGALASLLDTTAMVAAWSSGPVPENMRGTTVGLTISYLAPANGSDVTAHGSVLRRGRNLATVDVEVRTSDDALVAKGLVTYKLG